MEVERVEVEELLDIEDGFLPELPFIGDRLKRMSAKSSDIRDGWVGAFEPRKTQKLHLRLQDVSLKMPILPNLPADISVGTSKQFSIIKSTKDSGSQSKIKLPKEPSKEETEDHILAHSTVVVQSVPQIPEIKPPLIKIASFSIPKLDGSKTFSQSQQVQLSEKFRALAKEQKLMKRYTKKREVGPPSLQGHPEAHKPISSVVFNGDSLADVLESEIGQNTGRTDRSRNKKVFPLLPDKGIPSVDIPRDSRNVQQEHRKNQTISSNKGILRKRNTSFGDTLSEHHQNLTQDNGPKNKSLPASFPQLSDMAQNLKYQNSNDPGLFINVIEQERHIYAYGSPFKAARPRGFTLNQKLRQAAKLMAIQKSQMAALENHFATLAKSHSPAEKHSLVTKLPSKMHVMKEKPLFEMTGKQREDIKQFYQRMNSSLVKNS